MSITEQIQITGLLSKFKTANSVEEAIHGRKKHVQRMEKRVPRAKKIITLQTDVQCLAVIVSPKFTIVM